MRDDINVPKPLRPS